LRVPGKAEARAEALVPTGRNAGTPDAAVAESAEDECSEASTGAWVRYSGVEVRAFIVLVYSGLVKLVPQAEIEREARSDAPIVLELHGVRAPEHADPARGVNAAAVGQSEFERGEATTATYVAAALSRQLSGRGAEVRQSGSVLLAKSDVG